MASIATGIQSAKNVVEFQGMKEAVRFFGYLSSAGKNRIISKSYGFATKDYRKALRKPGVTPRGESGLLGIKKFAKSKNGKRGRRRNKLINTISFARSRKYANTSGLIDPVWAGHMVKKGASHNHLIVLGRKKSVPTKKKAMSFYANKKVWVVKESPAVAPNNYVGKVAAMEKAGIIDNFGKAFIKGADSEAKRILKRYYVN